MTATFYVGDSIEVMSKLPENSVDLVLTSPPFLALRSYLPQDHPDKNLEGGSQATPGEYVDWLLDVVEACARVLAPHGSLCFELGDTYSGSGGAGGDYAADGLREGQPVFRANPGRAGGTRYQKPGLPSIPARPHADSLPKNGPAWPLAKSLSLIPESFRWAMVYGHNPFTGRKTEPWRLRNVIRWVRPNPPVGALGDKFRPATSELMVFCKAKDRYFDLDAVREPYSELTMKVHGKTLGGVEGGINGPKERAASKDDALRPFERQALTHSGAPPLDWWNIPLLEGEEPTRYGPKDEDTNAVIRVRKSNKTPRQDLPEGGEDRTRGLPTMDVRTQYANELGAPPLDWWNIPPGGYPGAHYAVWPAELLVKPVKAMCPEQVCRTCGEPRRRMVGEAEYVPSESYRGGHTNLTEAARVAPGVNQFVDGGGRASVIRQAPTLGFSDCGHNDWRPGLVLDCFGGSGTTAAVATGHGRDCILIDLDERNFDLALERVGPLILELGLLP